MNLRLLPCEVLEGSPKPTARCQFKADSSRSEPDFLFSIQSSGLIQQNFQAFLKVPKKTPQKPTPKLFCKSQTHQDKKRRLSFRALQIRHWAFNSQLYLYRRIPAVCWDSVRFMLFCVDTYFQL